MKAKHAALVAVGACLTGCGTLDRIALHSTADILINGRGSTLEEPDYELGREAAASQLKLLEALLATDPGNRALHVMAAEGFGGAAFLFVEDAEPARAKGLYRRGRDHALAALSGRRALRGLADRPLDDFSKALQETGRQDVPALFWAGFCWAGEINLSKDDAAALADLPRAVGLMSRVAELDPSYHFAGSDLFFGVYYASRPPLLGGDPQRALKHFTAAQRLTQDQYLMTSVLEARWYAVAVQDRALFKHLLAKVAESPSGRLPEARLTDEAAKRKAARLLEKIDDYF